MHPQISVSSICFIGEPLNDVVRHWDDVGARRVSLLSPDVLKNDLSALRTALAERRLETVTHNFMRDLSVEPRQEHWQAARTTLTSLIHRVAELGGRSIYMLTGGFGKLTWEEAADRFSAAIAPCLPIADSAGVRLAIENTPPLYGDLHIAHSLRDAVKLAELAGIGVCIDLSTCWTESGLKESIERAVPRCAVVQVSDYVCGDRALPARAVPGDGAIQLERTIKWLLDAGYDGCFDLELIGPRIDKEGRVAAVRRAAQNVGEILSRLGA
jgi:sugar phosphate isomerase/epimerase